MRVVLTIVCSAVVVAACSSSNRSIVEPSTPQGLAAVHFDSLLGVACREAASDRCDFLGSFPVPFAFGASASPLSVDTGTGPLAWQGLVYDLVDTGAAGSESFAILVFSDTNVMAGVLVNGGSSQFLFNTQDVEMVSNLSAGDSSVATTGNCAKPPTLRFTILPNVAGTGATCTIRSFTINASMGFASGSNVTIAPQTVNGIRIVQ